MAALVPSVDPRTGLVVEDVAPESTPEDVDTAVVAATRAAPVLAALGAAGRAPSSRAWPTRSRPTARRSSSSPTARPRSAGRASPAS